MRRAITLMLLIASPLVMADERPQPAPSAGAKATAVAVAEGKTYVRDLREISFAPAHWKQRQWLHFAEGATAVAVMYTLDERLYRNAQNHRSAFTNDFAKMLTPFGGRRAEIISVALIGSGLWLHDNEVRDAGRDSLESEILAGGLVTPLLKRAFGRARPSQDAGAHSFTPFSSGHESFPSGHATNAFACATAIAAHSDGWLVPTVAYTLATGVAFSRVNDRAHFPSDVLAGALIGRAIAKSVVHQRHSARASWSIEPAFLAGHPGLAIHVTTR